jgi:hypothetical protein
MRLVPVNVTVTGNVMDPKSTSNDGSGSGTPLGNAPMLINAFVPAGALLLGSVIDSAKSIPSKGPISGSAMGAPTSDNGTVVEADCGMKETEGAGARVAGPPLRRRQREELCQQSPRKITEGWSNHTAPNSSRFPRACAGSWHMAE